MDFKVIDITSAVQVKVKSSGVSTIILPTSEVIELEEDEIGFLEGRFSHHWKGAYFQGGILNPGWKGKITCELLVIGGEFEINKGEQIAHAVILKGKNVLGYVYKGTTKWQEGG